MAGTSRRGRTVGRLVVLCALAAGVLVAPQGAATQTACRTPAPYTPGRGDSRESLPDGSNVRYGPSWAGTGQHAGVERSDGYVFADGGTGGAALMGQYRSGQRHATFYVFVGPEDEDICFGSRLTE